MARLPGAEDKAGFRDDQYFVDINDSLGLKVSSTDVIAGGSFQSASVAVPVLSASTTTATLTTTQHFVLADASAAEMGLTLPAAAETIGRSYTVKKIDGGANAVLLSGASGESVEGDPFQTIGTTSGSLTVMSDGVGYHIVAFFSGVNIT